MSQHHLPKTPHANRALSARTIAAEVANGTLTANAAIRLGEPVIAAREDQLKVFTVRNPAPAPSLDSSSASSSDPATGSKNAPLCGVSVGVKDIFDTADFPTSYGSEIYNAHRCPTDAALVTMLKNAGATMAGKTVTTEFAWLHPAETRNPVHEDHTPGGSSSGSAAGVAAGYFPAAIGSQTGGSIIRPAAFCGVAGYKPSFRLFPTLGIKHFSWSLDTVGFFAASIADAAFVAAACSGRSLAVNERSNTPPHIAVYQSGVDGVMSEAMSDALDHAASCARRWGATLRRVTEPDTLAAARDAHAPIQDFEAAMALAYELQTQPEKLSPALHAYLTQAKSVSPDTYDNARRIANRARKASHALFEQGEVLLMPSAPDAAPASLDTTGDSIFNRLWTLLGLPAVNITGLKNADGMPLGLQMVGRFGKDRELLQAAHWLETRLQNSR
ncbi:MAG: amidase [Pseudomonadota bacterium]